MKKTRIVLSVIAVVAIAAILLGVWWFTRPETQEGAKTVHIDVVIDGTTKSYTYHTDAELLSDVLLENELIVGEQRGFGLFVTTVEGVTVDEGNVEWWCFTKDGEMLLTGIDQTPVYDGDRFEVTFTVGYDF